MWHGALWPVRGLAAWKIAGKLDAWLAWLADGMAVFTELQPVAHCGQCALAHACLSTIA